MTRQARAHGCVSDSMRSSIESMTGCENNAINRSEINVTETTNRIPTTRPNPSPTRPGRRTPRPLRSHGSRHRKSCWKNCATDDVKTGTRSMIERFIALAWIFVSISPVLAQSSKPSSSEQPRPIKIEDRLSDPVYVAWTSEPSVAQCVRCHLNDKGTEFSRQREMRDWIDRDKHAIARQRVEPFSPENQETELLDLFTRLNRLALKQAAEEEAKGYTLDRSAIGLREVPAEWIGTSNLLSRRMCDKLWGEGTVETAAGYQRFREACLTCHGGVSQEQTASAESLSDYPIGIDCLYCHQQGEQDAWQKEHLDEDRWRLSSPRQKESRGMSDMVDTANQASTCLDCHVGNRDKNMFVTHQMYAAGHPPLPAIEVQTFCDQLPMHWQTPSQLHDNLQDGKSRDEYFAINYPGVAEGGPQQFSETYFDTRKLFIGALQARRKSVKLLVDSAATDDWGDYALYDCAACHHELRSESARQRRYLTATRSV